MVPFTCAFLPPVNVLLGLFEIFGLALASAALLRVGCWGGFSSHIVYTRRMERLESSHYWGFYNVRSPTPLPFSKILRSPLRTWGFHFDCLPPMFLKESPILSMIFICNFCAIWIWSSVPTFWIHFLLLSVIPSPSTAPSFWWSLGILNAKCVPKLSGGLLFDCMHCLGNSSSCLLFYSSC